MIAKLRARDWSSHPPQADPAYKSTRLRAQHHALVPLDPSGSELSGPAFGHSDISDIDHDLTLNAVQDGEPLGERIIVAGRIVDEGGGPVRNTLVELWQANAAGRYAHASDNHDAPLDANFLGTGRTMTDSHGRYRFVTVRPGAYPWKNHANAWRPAHIHFSVFGPAFLQRLVTQMYFPGDPLLRHDPIFNAVPDVAAKQRLASKFSLDLTEPEWALGYEFDIVLRGPQQTPMEK